MRAETDLPSSLPRARASQLPGPPLTEHTLASLLTSKGIVVGLGHATSDATRNARFDALWNHHADPAALSPAAALALVSANLYELLGIDAKPGLGGLIAVEGDAFQMGSRVVGAVDNGQVELF